ncbi:MAG: tetratricopeptide repeat protein, partial [Acidobacteriota bacterium]
METTLELTTALSQGGDPCSSSRLMDAILPRLSRRPDAEAIQHLGHLLDLALAHGDRRRSATLLNRLALAEGRRQNWRAGLEYRQAAQWLWRSLGSEGLVATSQLNFGSLYFRMGKFDDATLVLDEACRRLRSIPDLASRFATCLLWRGRVHLVAKRFDDAKDDFEHSLSIRRSHKGRLPPALEALGLLAQERGDPAGALKLFNEALMASVSPADRANTHGNVASALYELGEYLEALRHLTIAFRLARSLGLEDANFLLHNLHLQALCFAALDQTTHFRAAAETLIAAFEAERTSGEGALSSSFLSRRRHKLGELIALFIDEEENEKAFEIAELARARGLLDQLVWPPHEVRRRSPQGLMDRDQDVRSQLGQTTRRLEQALDVASSGELETLRTQSRSQRLQLMAIEAEMRQELGASGAPSLDIKAAEHL